MRAKGRKAKDARAFFWQARRSSRHSTMQSVRRWSIGLDGRTQVALYNNPTISYHVSPTFEVASELLDEC